MQAEEPAAVEPLGEAADATLRDQGSRDEEADGRTSPVVMSAKDLPRSEIAKIRRIVTPKPCSGKLDVPKDIMELWQTEKGRETLKQQWCKSGGMKALDFKIARLFLRQSSWNAWRSSA